MMPLAWGVALVMPQALAAWGARVRVTSFSSWVFDPAHSASSGKRRGELVKRLTAGALARAEETERAMAKNASYVTREGMVVCVVDDGDLVICTQTRGSVVDVTAWLRSTGDALLHAMPRLAIVGEEEARRFQESSPWFEGRRSRQAAREAKR